MPYSTQELAQSIESILQVPAQVNSMLGTLTIVIKSSDTAICPKIIELLESTKSPFGNVTIIGLGYSKMFAKTFSGKYQEQKGGAAIILLSMIIGLGTLGISVYCLSVGGFFNFRSSVSTSTPKTNERFFVSRSSEYGYEVWSELYIC
ncbi:MAG: hypothetical protein ACYTXC_21275 [Nostoc sp.]